MSHSINLLHRTPHISSCPDPDYSQMKRNGLAQPFFPNLTGWLDVAPTGRPFGARLHVTRGLRTQNDHGTTVFRRHRQVCWLIFFLGSHKTSQWLAMGTEVPSALSGRYPVAATSMKSRRKVLVTNDSRHRLGVRRKQNGADVYERRNYWKVTHSGQTNNVDMLVQWRSKYNIATYSKTSYILIRNCAYNVECMCIRMFWNRKLTYWRLETRILDNHLGKGLRTVTFIFYINHSFINNSVWEATHALDDAWWS